VLDWGGPGTADDPHLDIDDTNGFGPENTNIDEPANGTYRVGVHAFSGSGNVTVRIYCGGDRTTPIAEIGPVAIGTGARQFWRVADVDITGPALCTVTELVGADGTPNITTQTDARANR
jgi:hypothetical protein